jgi:hypothetical protein
MPDSLCGRQVSQRRADAIGFADVLRCFEVATFPEQPNRSLLSSGRPVLETELSFLALHLQNRAAEVPCYTIH